MSKVTVKNLKAVENELKRRFSRALSDEALLDQIGKDWAEQVKGSTREGKFIGDNTELAEIDTSSTVPQRKRLSKTNKTHGAYSPARSNLTLTGELIESIKHTTNPAKKQVLLQATGDHSPYKGAKGPHKSKPITNSEILRHQAKQGRRVLGVSVKLIERYKKFVISHLRRKLVIK